MNRSSVGMESESKSSSVENATENHLFFFFGGGGGGGGEGDDVTVRRPDGEGVAHSNTTHTEGERGEGGGEEGGGGLCGNESDPYFLGPEVNLLTVPINGHLLIVVVLLTVVTNSLVCVVLMKRNMRNATNVILVAMAMSTTLTGVWPMPAYVYFYSFGGYLEWVPYRWCFLYSTLTEHLPTIFHTASIWLTVALAMQRYFFVCHSQRAKRWGSVENAVRGAVAVHALSLLLHLTRFLEWHHTPISVPSKTDPTGGRHVTGCCSEFTSFIMRHQIVYFNVYYCVRVVLVHLVPCSALVLLNALLIHTMRTAHARREVLLKLNRKSESRRLAESNSTTMMLVAVVGVFLLVELPMAVLFILLLVDNGFELMILEKDSTSVASLLINLFILLSYPINFFIYCGMSRQFRETFRGLFGKTIVHDVTGEEIGEEANDNAKKKMKNKKKKKKTLAKRDEETVTTIS